MSAEPVPVEPVSLWALKPWWCQPWSIVLTGLVITGGSWLLVQRWWLTTPLALAVGLWWWLFLVLVPRAYSQQLGAAQATGCISPPPGPESSSSLLPPS